MSAYIDTSALAKCYIREPRSLDVLDWADAEDEVCTGPLALVEFRCLLARRRRAAQIEAMLERSALAEFDRDMLGRMWRVDALHLAYARHFGAQRFASADKSQADAARALGLDVITFY
ncbi:MAG: type II toxin-antitoxin system VapC family toxin [Thiobacillus sp.]|nr:type II toxin-antitoxin system VapC family toxin [Thiobacillus sp.]